jgi:DNA repair protein RadC
MSATETQSTKNQFVKYSIKLVREESQEYDLPDVIAKSTEAAAKIINRVCKLHDSPVEKIGILCLNSENRVVGIHPVHVGGVDSSMVDVRTIFQNALLNNAVRIIAFHNHPSQTTTISPNDKEVTRRLKSAGEIMNIKLLDHIIICGENSYVSFKEQGLL